MKAFIDSQSHQDFAKEIDTFLYAIDIYENENDSKFMTVKAIVESCPEFLATKGGNMDWLPFHRAAQYATASSYRYLKLFIDVGLTHNIGGMNSRGGLLLPSRYDSIVLHYIKNPEMFELLKQMNPPLFYIEDVQKYHLFHRAITNEDFDLAKYFCGLDPSCILQKDKENQLPIHCLDYDRRCFANNDAAQDMLQYLIQASLSLSPSNPTIGGLFTIMPECHMYLLTLGYIVEEHEGGLIWDLIEKALSNHKKRNDLPCILHQTIRFTSYYCSEVLKRFPTSVHVRDTNNMNRMPIHVALEKGLEWSLELEYLIATSQEYLKDVDPVTKLPPFLLAGMGRSCDLRVIYDLLRKHPEHVGMLEDGSGYKYISFEDNHK